MEGKITRLSIKADKSGIAVYVPAHMSMDEICSELYHRFSLSAGALEKKGSVSVAFKGKKLSESESNKIIDFLNNMEMNNISFIYDRKSDITIDRHDALYNDRIMKTTYQSNENVVDSVIRRDAREIPYIFIGNIGKKQTLEIKGNVIIIGNVAREAKVVSGGNIIVIGDIYGTVIAGKCGGEKYFVLAMHMEPRYLQINKVKTLLPNITNYDNSSVLATNDGTAISITYIWRQIQEDYVMCEVIVVTSGKGGVGKTTLTLNLAGLYFLNKMKVLIIDLDLYAGGIATCLNIDNKKDIYMLVDSLSNNKYVELKDYVTSYNSGIDILANPKDPRDVSKIESKYINKIFELAKLEYDVILIDTSHLLDEICLMAVDASYMSAYVITNDLVDLKNMKTLISIFNEMQKTNYKIVLNNARDTGRDYLSNFDIRNMLKANVDYTISKNFYIKNIDKYVLRGEILTLNKTITMFNQSDINNMNKLALSLIKEDKEGEKQDDSKKDE